MLALAGPFAAALDLQDVARVALPTNAVILLYSPGENALVEKNSDSAIAVVDIPTGNYTLRLANYRFTDLALAPSGRYAFGADYGGENIGYGTPASTSYVHRVDLHTKLWDSRAAYIAGNVQPVSNTQVILKSLDQWVTFTNNAWGNGSDLVPLNTSSGGPWGPGYYATVYSGDFRYDTHTQRLIHGNSGLSSQEIQAFRVVNDDFVRQEGSGTYGSAQGYGGTVVLANDGRRFYYGELQVDALDVTHNTHVFPENIYAATAHLALGDGKYYDAATGELLGSLPFSATVYGVNPHDDDFWAYEAATTTAHHFAAAAVPPAAASEIPAMSMASEAVFLALLLGVGVFVIRRRL